MRRNSTNTRLLRSAAAAAAGAKKNTAAAVHGYVQAACDAHDAQQQKQESCSRTAGPRGQATVPSNKAGPRGSASASKYRLLKEYSKNKQHFSTVEMRPYMWVQSIKMVQFAFEGAWDFIQKPRVGPGDAWKASPYFFLTFSIPCTFLP